MPPRRRREYLQLLDASKAAVELSVDCFNRVRNPYRDESTLILMTNAWELLAKAALVKQHQSIKRGQRGETIGPETAVARLKDRKILTGGQSQTIQQIISLRHARDPSRPSPAARRGDAPPPLLRVQVLP